MTASGQNSVIRRCQLQCLLCPKADTAGRFMSKDDDRRRDWLDRRRFYIDALVTLAVATAVHYDGFRPVAGRPITPICGRLMP